MSSEIGSRVRYGEAFWRAHHEAWQQSALNQRQYCEAHGIPLKAFGNWRARFKAEPQLAVRKLLYRRHGPGTTAQALDSFRNQCRFRGIVWMTTSQIICQCGALYERTEFHEAPREADSFICPGCGHTLEIFSDVKGPRYRLISAPVRKPESPS